MRPIDVADYLLLIGAPTIFIVLMTIATLTPGNPIAGLVIGWLATLTWSTLGSLRAWKKFMDSKE